MTMLQILLYIAIPAILLLVLLLVFILINITKKEKIQPNEILELFKKQEVKKVEYIRNKVVVHFIDVSTFDVEKLKEYGATGINIIGDKLKFYFEKENQTKEIFNQITNKIT